MSGISKKTSEMIGGLILLILAAGVFTWLVISNQILSPQAPDASTSTLGLPTVPIEEIQKAESSTLITIKSLKKFGNVPIFVPGEQVNKTGSPFAADDSLNDNPAYFTEKFSLNYPKTWYKILNKKKEVEFTAPLKNDIPQGSVRLIVEKQAEGKQQLSSVLKAKTDSLLLGLPGLKKEAYNGAASGAIEKGKIAYSYKIGDTERSGWVAGISHVSPTIEASSALYQLILNNQSRSKYLQKITKELQSQKGTAPDIEMINKKMADLLATSILTDELSQLGEKLEYHLASYAINIILIYDAENEARSMIDNDADMIYQKASFKEAVTGESIDKAINSGNTLELNTQGVSESQVIE